jgi:hypothetical protein
MTPTSPPTRTPRSTGPNTAPLPWTAVGREQVHKTAPAEVLVTALSVVSPDLVAVAARWPAAHRLYDRRPGTVGHLLLVVETIRQAGLCLAHAHLGVPLGERFIFHGMAVRSTAPTSGTGEPTGGVAPDGAVTLLEPTLRYRAGRPSGATLTARVEHDATPWATAEADFSWVPGPVYDRLRTAGRDRARAGTGGVIPRPRQAGTVDPTATGQDRFPVVVDLEDPTFFDHEVDHLPGMLLIDAALRAAAVRSGPGIVPVGIDVTFDRFAELDRPTWVRTRSRGDADGPAVDVVLDQGGSPVARARVLVDEPAGGRTLRPGTEAAAAAAPGPRTRPAGSSGHGVR